MSYVWSLCGCRPSDEWGIEEERSKVSGELARNESPKDEIQEEREEAHSQVADQGDPSSGRA